MNAVDLLHNMVRQYAALDSYRDTGYVTRISLPSGGVNRLFFSTLYQQPSLFRFTFFRRHPYPPLAHILTEHTAGFDGIEAYVLRKGPGDSRALKGVERSLKSAIAGATGISSGSAHTIVRLLLADMDGLSVIGSHQTRTSNPDAVMDDPICYSVTAQLPGGGQQEIMD